MTKSERIDKVLEAIAKASEPLDELNTALYELLEEEPSMKDVAENSAEEEISNFFKHLPTWATLSDLKSVLEGLKD